MSFKYVLFSISACAESLNKAWSRPETKELDWPPRISLRIHLTETEGMSRLTIPMLDQPCKMRYQTRSIWWTTKTTMTKTTWKI